MFTSLLTTLVGRLHGAFLLFNVTLQESSVPAGGDVATNRISLFPRPLLGYWRSLYLSDDDNLQIPTDGYLSRWQFYVKSPGSAALQVWRPRPDLGANR